METNSGWHVVTDIDSSASGARNQKSNRMLSRAAPKAHTSWSRTASRPSFMGVCQSHRGEISRRELRQEMGSIPGRRTAVPKERPSHLDGAPPPRRSHSWLPGPSRWWRRERRGATDRLCCAPRRLRALCDRRWSVDRPRFDERAWIKAEPRPREVLYSVPVAMLRFKRR